MKRRYIAIIVIIVPFIIALILNKFYPKSYEWLSAYMIAVAIAFKGAIVSFFIASKLKIITFLKGLTILEATTLLIKRWFLDNIFAKWIERNIIQHLKNVTIDLANYYKALNFTTKLKNALIPIFILFIIAIALYSGGYLDKFLLLTELKLFVIALSKSILAIITHVLSFIFDSWITPILEVFALSFILNWLEEKLGDTNPIIKILNSISGVINYIINIFTNIDSQLEPYINKPISKRAKYLNLKLSKYLNSKKIAFEYQQFEKLEQSIMKAHIDSYFSFKNIDKIKDKKELYTLINQKSKDNLNIVAYLSRNAKGELLDENVEDSFYHDIFILEGIATSSKDGIKKELTNKPDATDFWVLNTSNFPVTIYSKNGDFNQITIKGNSLKLIQSNKPQEYNSGNILFRFQNITKTVIAII